MDNSLLEPSILANINNFPLLARTVVEGFIAGMHRSLYHGFGAEFMQYRNYTRGDDLKYIDWKVYARQDRFQVKVFQEETNTNCYIVVDCSASMDYTGTTSAMSKLRFATVVAACLAYLVNRQGDNVGLCAYGDRILTDVRPGHRSGQVHEICTELVRLEAGGTGTSEMIFRHLQERFNRRGIVILISDFIDADSEAMRKSLRRFRLAHHDCVLLQVLDADEQTFPFSGSVRFVDSESSDEIITAPERVREVYLERFGAAAEAFRRFCLEADIDHASLTNSDVDSLGHALAAYLHRRERVHR
jgi:uncharacterized protein (DUF58 family)